jgi:hypothetical protein
LSLALKEDFILEVFENEVLRIVFGHKRTKQWEHEKKIQDATPNINLYFSQVW